MHITEFGEVTFEEWAECVLFRSDRYDISAHTVEGKDEALKKVGMGNDLAVTQ